MREWQQSSATAIPGICQSFGSCSEPIVACSHSSARSAFLYLHVFGKVVIPTSYFIFILVMMWVKGQVMYKR